MQLVRPPVAANPRLFGRGPARVAAAAQQPRMALSEDLKLFATTFAAGFLFVSIVIG